MDIATTTIGGEDGAALSEAGRDHIIIRDPGLGALNPPQVIVVGDSISNLISQINSMINNGKVNQVAVVKVRNVSSDACSITGHPRLALLNSRNSLPSRTARLGSTKHTIIGNLVPGRSATVLVAYSTRTTQSGTRCRRSTNLLVAMPGMGQLNVPAKISACNDGRLYTSPVLPGSLSIVQGNRGPQSLN